MRQPGYYWLRSKERWSIGEWRNNSTWWIIGHDGWFEDSDFDEIDERRIERETQQVFKGIVISRKPTKPGLPKTRQI